MNVNMWAMFEADTDGPFALMLDSLVTYMTHESGEDRETVRARIERVLGEQVEKRDRQERREYLAVAGVGL